MVPACSLGDVLSGGCFCVRFTHLHKFSRIYTNFSHFPAKFVYLCICVCVFVFSGTLQCDVINILQDTRFGFLFFR
jgi:hypothetical protein